MARRRFQGTAQLHRGGWRGGEATASELNRVPRENRKLLEREYRYDISGDILAKQVRTAYTSMHRGDIEMNITKIDRRDVSVLGRPRHYEFTIILENEERVKVTASELLDSLRCQATVLEQTGYYLELPMLNADWSKFLKGILSEKP